MNALPQTSQQRPIQRSRATLPQRRRAADREIAGLLLHIKGLVLVRALLEQRGASEGELAEHSAELNRRRDRLAELVRDTASG
jgi:hypothetical protein